MQKEKVRFKSSAQGLQLLVEENLPFEEALQLLKQKMVETKDYFSEEGDLVLARQAVKWTNEEIKQLGFLLANYKLNLKIREIVDFKMLTECGAKDICPEADAGELHNQLIPEKIDYSYTNIDWEKAIIAHKTIRSGTKIVNADSVVIIGDVNPGAEIIAGGNIFVFGNMYGFAHAGAYGDRNAIIMASKLRPIQLRIDDLIANYSPENLHEAEKNIQGEVAFIENNAVMVKILEKRRTF